MNSKLLSILALSIVFLGGGLLVAQTGGDPAPVPPPAPSSQIPVPPSASGKKEGAKNFKAEISEFAKRLRELRKQAEREKDVIKLDCVNAQLLALKSRARAADEAAFDLGALDGDKAAKAEADHAYRKLYLSHQGALAAYEMAEQCVGDELSLVGDTTTQQTGGPDVVDDPTDQDPGAAGGFDPINPEGPPNRSAF